MEEGLASRLKTQLAELEELSLFKREAVIASPQSPHLRLKGGEKVLNLCANNYLGLANHPRLIESAKKALDSHGLGMASVRFICGTQDIHLELEKRLASFLKQESVILYSSCFDANGGLFETLLGKEDAVFSDALNHASIIDGIRLCKAERFVYPHADMVALEQSLQKASAHRAKLIVTDGVFSMDGTRAPLKEIGALAKKYSALVMVDDCHATGFVGGTGRGSHEHCEAMDQVDIISSTLGKALGGASGGFVAARGEIVDILRQRSRPYLFSNSLAPPIVAASLEALKIVEKEPWLREQLIENTYFFRQGLEAAGFNVLPGDHPIIPIMLGDAALAKDFAKALMDQGIYVVSFCYPVVPKGKARLRTQMSAAHTRQDLEQALDTFVSLGKKMGII